MEATNASSGLPPWKGHSRIPVGCHMASMIKDCCHCSLGTTGGKSFWHPLSPSTKGLSFPELHALLSQVKSFLFTTIINRFQSVHKSLAHTYPKWWGKELFAKRKISCYFLFSWPKIISKEPSLISCFNFHVGKWTALESCITGDSRYKGERLACAMLAWIGDVPWLEHLSCFICQPIDHFACVLSRWSPHQYG